MASTPRIHTWLYSFLVILLTGCTRMPEDMHRAERLLETAPDSALVLLQHLTPRQIASPPIRALYGLLLVRALDLNLLPLTPDTLLDYSLTWYAARDDYARLGLCCLYRGRMAKYALQYEKAMSYYLRGLDAAQLHPDNPLTARLNFDLGDIYNAQRDYPLARQKYRLAHAFFSRAHDQPHAFYALLNIGRTYYAARDYPRAGRYYLQLSPLARDSLQRGALCQETGLNFFKARQYDSALVYLRRVLPYPYIGNNRAIRYYFLADLYADLRQPDSARLYAFDALRYNPDIRTRRECYRILFNSIPKTRNHAALNLYMALYQCCTDSIRTINTQARGSLLETLHLTGKEAAQNRTRLTLAAIAFACIVLALVLMYILRIRRHRAEKLQLEQWHLSRHAAIRGDFLIKYRETLHHNIQQLRTSQYPDWKKANAAERNRLDRAAYTQILHLDRPETFYREMDTALNNLPTRLRTLYPTLTNKEITWCCLHMLEIPVQYIYLLLDYQVEGLKKMKQRLARKAGLQNATSLKELLHKMLME